MRNDYVIERDCCHAGLLGEVLQTQLSELRIKIGVRHSLAFEHQHARVAKEFGCEKSFEASSLLRGQGQRANCVSVALSQNIGGDQV